MNEAETIIKNKLEDKGLKVLNSGFPDFLVQHPSNAICFVEVKNGDDKVRENQRYMHEKLKAAGIPVSVWHLDDGLDNDLTFGTNFSDEYVHFMDKYLKDVVERLNGALEILSMLRHIFIAKDIELEKSGLDPKKYFDWGLIDLALRETLLTKDANKAVRQLKFILQGRIDFPSILTTQYKYNDILR